MKDYDALMGMPPVVVEQSYTNLDSCLYALSVGCGMDLADDWMRRYLGPLPPSLTLPGLATVVAAPRVHTIGLGATLSGILHGNQGLVVHAPLPVEGRLRSESRVVSVFDRGEGRGTLLSMVRELHDAQSGTHYASLSATYVCRLDQAAGAPPAAKPVANPMPDRAPDLVVAVPTSPQAAQLFALTGDQNPLHMVPEVAIKMGFPAPILHGMATYGICAAFAEKALCEVQGASPTRRLGAISGRFSAPVFPGETLELALWNEASGARLEARVPGRGVVVIAEGQIAIEEAF